MWINRVRTKYTHNFISDPKSVIASGQNRVVCGGLSRKAISRPCHSNVQGGRMRIPLFSGRGGGVYFSRLSWEDFPVSRKKNLKGSVFKPVSRDMGYFFSRFPKKLRKGGMMFAYTFPEPSTASREKKRGGGGLGPLLHCISVVGFPPPPPPPGSGKLHTHISRAQRKEMD